MDKICLACNVAMIQSTEDVPKPHHAKLICPRCGKHGGWVSRPWTPERAETYVMPIGKYRGQTLGSIGHADRPYVIWIAESVGDRSIARAAQAWLDNHPA